MIKNKGKKKEKKMEGGRKILNQRITNIQNLLVITNQYLVMKIYLWIWGRE